MMRAFHLLLVALISVVAGASDCGKLPVVINTWPFVDANSAGKWEFKFRDDTRENQCTNGVGRG